MKAGPMLRLPWRGEDVPHAILDVGRPCDIACPGCFNGSKRGFTSAEQLEADLEALCRRRRLHTVSLTGGEPMLHPELDAIVAAIARRGIRPALLTHGQHLTETRVSALRRAGLSAILLHIQPPQRRRDIDAHAPPPAWRALRAEKAALVHAHGIKVGLTWIGYRTRLDDLSGAIDEVMTSPHLDILLVTGYRDFAKFRDVRGSTEASLRQSPPRAAIASTDETRMCDLAPVARRAGLQPFTFVGSSHDAASPRWLTHLSVTARCADGASLRADLRPAASDWFFTRLMRFATGRYVFLYTPARWQLLVQLLANAFTGGRPAPGLRVFAAALRGATLADKHILLQEGPTLRPDGTIEFCEHCPDAVMQRGALVPVCLADRMAAAPAPLSPALVSLPQ